jgi:hypothetical protein
MKSKNLTKRITAGGVASFVARKHVLPYRYGAKKNGEKK